ncbi:hypothetical protein OJAV_G00155980 [Oryzias javanicus]|uniref:Uncharacterized protein n=1 Tax=Oryzias javanicus TaxID=123683 RepID=A0A437CI17_ORYJA|nr:hypothetical protein OJAV_G00155980 [Oryzias javanicus]
MTIHAVPGLQKQLEPHDESLFATSLALFNPLTLDMGSKMSSSGGSSEQNTNSELTSMALVPHGPLPDPSEPKQQNPNNGVEEDLDGDDAMGAEDLNQTHNEPNSDDHLGSETASRTDHQQSEDTPAMADSNSQETSATDGDVRPVQVRRKRGRSRRKKLLLQRRRKTSKKVNAKIPLPAGVINHSTDSIPNSIENCSSPQTAPSDGGLNDKTESSIAKKQRRGRPKKSISAPPPPPPAPVIVSGPSRSLRSRGQPPSFTPEQAGGAPTEDSETSIFLDFKRRLRKRPGDQGVPANMSKQDNSQHALPPLKDEKADEPMELKTDGDTSRQEQLTDELLPLDSEVKLSEDLNPMEYPQLKESINVDENKNLETPDSSGCPVELLVLPKAKRKKSDRQQYFFRLKKGGKKRRRRPVPEVVL